MTHPRLDDAVRQSRILIVDDNPANVALLEFILQDSDFENFVGITDSRKVETLCTDWEFDLILLDIRMPYMDGFEVMEALHARLVDDYLPVIVLTAHTDTQTRQRALALGAKDFIGKPFEAWEVMYRIRNMLEMRLFYKRQRHRGDELEELVRQRTEKIRFAQLEIVQRLGRAAEYRDNETGNHVRRMSRACQRLAQEVGCDDSFSDTLLHAALMHDIGKIGIADSVLLKPGKLTPEEFAIMQRHTSIGADILAGGESEVLRLAATVALTHHEKWDGSGYPKGLAGEQIPLVGRIVAICDVFDALTSARPYKTAWSEEDALEFIRQQAGKHFDPELVPAFLRIMPEIRALRERFSDD
jgi:putative two-component system response regulator